MGKDYFGLNARAALTSVAAGGQALVASPWSDSDQQQIIGVIETINKHKSPTPEERGAATRVAREGLTNDTYGSGARDVIDTLYFTSPDSASQAHVVAGLLDSHSTDDLRRLLQDGDNRNMMRQHISDAQVDRLATIASIKDPVEQNTKLIEFTKAAIAPQLRDQSLDHATAQDHSGQGGSLPNQEIVQALRTKDTAALGRIIAKSSVQSVASLAAAQGESVRDMVNALRSNDAHIQDFVDQTNERLDHNHAPVQSVWGQQADSGDLDVAALKDLLMAPNANPASLAKSHGGSPHFQGRVLQIFIGGGG